MKDGRIKISDNFYMDEFCNPSLYPIVKNNLTDIYKYLDQRIVNICQQVRNMSGWPILINNWFNGGDLKERCIREPGSKTGAARSRHKYLKKDGKVTKKCDAVDITIGNMTAAEMHEWVKVHSIILYDLGLRCVEHESLTPTWVHLDLRYVDKPDTIQIVDLNKVVDTWEP